MFETAHFQTRSRSPPPSYSSRSVRRDCIMSLQAVDRCKGINCANLSSNYQILRGSKQRPLSSSHSPGHTGARYPNPPRARHCGCWAPARPDGAAVRGGRTGLLREDGATANSIRRGRRDCCLGRQTGLQLGEADGAAAWGGGRGSCAGRRTGLRCGETGVVAAWLGGRGGGMVSAASCAKP